MDKTLEEKAAEIADRLMEHVDSELNGIEDYFIIFEVVKIIIERLEERK
jgi:hypothetical protein